MPQQTIAVINGTSRTLSHLIPQALAKGDKVRALVRSAPRFLSKTEEHDNLSVYEWSNFSDVDHLAEILDGVDVVYVALIASGKALVQPMWLNENAVTSIATVLHDRVAPGKRSPTKVVILAAHQTRPDYIRSEVAEVVLGHQFNDLRAAQEYLLKQRNWLDFVIVAPGLIVDSESSGDDAVIQGVKLEEKGYPAGAISCARLAAAMQLGASQPQWAGKFVLPVPTSKVTWGLGEMRSTLEVLRANIVHRLIPAMIPLMGFSIAAAGLGYVFGVREQGTWLLQRYGVNLKA